MKEVILELLINIFQGTIKYFGENDNAKTGPLHH